MYLLNPRQGSAMKPQTMLSSFRQSNPLGSPMCPSYPGMNWNAEMKAVRALPVFNEKGEYAAAIDEVYFDIYPNAPHIPSGWESHPACAPWVDAWIRLYEMGKRFGRYRHVMQPPVGPAPARIRRRRGKTARTKGTRYSRIAKMFGV
jgi:hypothetical protein